MSIETFVCAATLRLTRA